MADPGSFQVRHYQLGDHLAVAEVFTRAVHELTTAEYNAAERLAWAPLPPDLERWRWRCELLRPYVAVDERGVVAFLELHPDGYIDCAYVHPEQARRGAMSRLMQHAEAVCDAAQLPRLSAHVSLTAQPFFAARGWKALGENRVERAGVVLVNIQMEKQLRSLGA